jgi:hypothetical protein
MNSLVKSFRTARTVGGSRRNRLMDEPGAGERTVSAGMKTEPHFHVLPAAEVRHTVLDDFGRKSGQT